jgi:PAS domain S-box-containing protein
MAAIDTAKLVQAMGDAVVVVDVAGNIVLWNPAATRLFGFTEEEALGRSLDLIIPERQRGRHWDGYAKTVDTGVTRYGSALLKVPALHRDGSTLSIAFTVALLTDANGKVEAVASVIRDETARFAEERALKKQVAELQAAQRAAGTATT